jgi:hypothetical protein
MQNDMLELSFDELVSYVGAMERLQLVQNAIDENKYLAQQKFDCQQWYGFLIDKDVLKLKPIDFDVEEVNK